MEMVLLKKNSIAYVLTYVCIYVSITYFGEQAHIINYKTIINIIIYQVLLSSHQSISKRYNIMHHHL